MKWIKMNFFGKLEYENYSSLFFESIYFYDYFLNIFSQRNQQMEFLSNLGKDFIEMGFSLTVQDGKDVGRQEIFDQPEISIGRTSDNDFILLDPGVSRKHALIIQENRKLIIQDLGSANGVTINGNLISRQQLNSGDKITLGPVVLLFEETSDARNTKRKQRTSSSEQDSLLKEESRRGTMAMQAIRRPRENLAANESALVPARRRNDENSSNILPKSRKRRSNPEVEQGRRISQIQESVSSRLSVSERARILRENKGLGGQVKLFLAEKQPATRKAILGGVILCGIFLFSGFSLLIIKQFEKTNNVEIINDMSQTHFSLTDSQVKKTFGYGSDLGVTTQTRYELHFDFEVSETIPAIYYLYFDSAGIESSEEVNISLNSVPIGYVNGGLGDYSKTQKIRLPKKHLNPGSINDILFDHMKNTRTSGEETWAISSVRLQQIPLPGCDARSGECEREAHKNYEIAEKLWGNRQMASENSYNALKNLNTAMLFLEAVDPKPEFTRSVQQMIRDVEKHLDGICSKTLLQIKRDEEMRNYQKVVAELKNGLLWYPGPDHHCRSKLENKLAEYE